MTVFITVCILKVYVIAVHHNNHVDQPISINMMYLKFEYEQNVSITYFVNRLNSILTLLKYTLNTGIFYISKLIY